MSSDVVALPSNKSFGAVFLVLFASTALYFFYNDSKAISYFLGFIAVLLLVTTLINAELLSPLNRLWMTFGLLLGKIISPIVIGIIFFGIFSPISLIMRFSGRDELRLKVEKRRSHWRIRQHTVDIRNHFKNQF